MAEHAILTLNVFKLAGRPLSGTSRSHINTVKKYYLTGAPLNSAV